MCDVITQEKESHKKSNNYQNVVIILHLVAAKDPGLLNRLRSGR